MTTLYKKDNKNAIRVWSIYEDGDSEILIQYGVLGGALQEQRENVPCGLAGRSLEQQVASRIESRINLQRDKGYVSTVEEAKEKATNSLGLPMPMLAKSFKNKIPENSLLQYKYDGNRCLITKREGKVFAYSRKGKLIKSIDHVLEAAKDIPEGMTLDGELYCHGVHLQTIRSWIAKEQPETKNLVYLCYDCIKDKEPYVQRNKWINEQGFEKPIIIAPTENITPYTEITGRLDAARSLGYEGLIIRDGLGVYEDGKRSGFLIKVKKWESEEFTVKDIVQSSEGWAILVCSTPHGSFRVSAPGSIKDKLNIWNNKEDYVGKEITVEFANLTKAKIPFHPTAIAFREPWE